MSNIKRYKEAIDSLHELTEAHYRAGEYFPIAIKAFEEIGDRVTLEYLRVLFEQSKRFAGKLKQAKQKIEKELGE